MTFQSDLQQQYHSFYRAHLQRIATTAPAIEQRLLDYKFQIFLSNPELAYVKNGLLVCGLKPYATAGTTYDFPLQRLPQNYHAYLDETWRTPYVKRALQLIELVQKDVLKTTPNPQHSLVVNWFFQRAEDAKQLKSMQLRLSDQVPFHQQILDFYQPKILLCIGNGNAFSAFAGMAKLHGLDIKSADTVDYLERSKLKLLRTKDRLIIGVPHLSRYVVNDRMQMWIKELSA